ncbi:cutinase-domain-containing protein [Sphaerosporella brunnea]|uniref:cutinase n=1 Tax=Sphaerosporella brunnea TaxID=1250544 RepID=A0A5J5EJ84_9PEZI|nr:cutinase-domain-containing protein [Sphaerosporella brunnea]
MKFYLFHSLLLAATALAAPTASVEKRQFPPFQTDYRGVEDGGCTPFTVIFARAIGEPGNVGISTGPPFFNALQQRLPDPLTIQGVSYDPTTQAGITSGAEFMVRMFEQAARQCPGTRIVLSGHAHGATVIHRALWMRSDTAADVRAIVTFGDPQNDRPYPGPFNDRVLAICHQDDPMCNGGNDPTGLDRTYGMDAPEAAGFAASRLLGN